MPVKPIRDSDVEKLNKQLVGILQRQDRNEMTVTLATLMNALLAKSDQNVENLLLLKSCQNKLDEANKKITELEKK